MGLISDFVAGRTPPQLYQAYLSPLFETWTGALIEALPPLGQSLDVACGTGIVTRKIVCQPNVERVVGVDLAPPMIEAARALTDPGLPVEFREGSADAIDLPGAQFDMVFCQQGLQFFPDKTAALNEACRLMKPGTKAAFSVWTSAGDGNPVFGAFETIVGEQLGEDLVPFGPFSFGHKHEIEGVFDAPDLTLVSLERAQRRTPLPDPRTLVLFDLLFLGRPGPDGSMQPLFAPDDSSRDELIERIIARLSEATSDLIQPDGGLRATSSAHIMVAEKRLIGLALKKGSARV